jgi:hypothetical protein
MIGAIVIGSFATFVEAGLMVDQFGLLHTDRLYNSFDDRRGRNGKHHPKALTSASLRSVKVLETIRQWYQTVVPNGKAGWLTHYAGASLIDVATFEIIWPISWQSA